MANRRVVAAIAACAATLCVASAASDGDARPTKDTVLVEINGVKLTFGDLEKKKPISVYQANTNFYEAERKAIEEIVEDMLLQQQAAKEGLTVDQLLDKHVKGTIAGAPSEEALRLYYEGVDTTEPYEAIRGKIIEALTERRMNKAKAAYMLSLRSQAPIILRLPPPRAPISMAGVPTRGPAKAAVQILEYADYECPVCQQIQPVVDRIEKEFSGNVSFAFKDFPLSQHPSAEKAAEASHCAEAQGKYWEFHDKVLTDRRPDLASLKSIARDLKMDGAAFDKCVDSGAKEAAVKAHLDEAQSMGLQGTPTFFVNGRYVTGNVSYERLRTVITEELTAAGVQLARPSGSAGEPHN